MPESQSGSQASLIYGLDARPLPEGYTPLEAEAVIKCLDQEGKVTLLTRGTSGLMIWDSIGHLTVALDQVRARAVRAFTPDGEGDDDD